MDTPTASNGKKVKRIAMNPHHNVSLLLLPLLVSVAVWIATGAVQSHLGVDGDGVVARAVGSGRSSLRWLQYPHSTPHHSYLRRSLQCFDCPPEGTTHRCRCLSLRRQGRDEGQPPATLHYYCCLSVPKGRSARRLLPLPRNGQRSLEITCDLVSKGTKGCGLGLRSQEQHQQQEKASSMRWTASLPSLLLLLPTHFVRWVMPRWSCIRCAATWWW